MNNKGEHVDQISSSIIWDCGSPLYDSYELVSLVNLIERNMMILPVVPEARYSSSLTGSEETDVVKMRRFYSSKRGENISSNGNKGTNIENLAQGEDASLANVWRGVGLKDATTIMRAMPGQPSWSIIFRDHKGNGTIMSTLSQPSSRPQGKLHYYYDHEGYAPLVNILRGHKGIGTITTMKVTCQMNP
ncbi:hypothetical protein P3L10_000197 [Capsicum annuum]